MTEAAWIFLFDRIPEYITGMTALIMAIVTWRGIEKDSQRKAAALQVAQTVQEVKETTAQIKVATDGGLTDVKEQLKAVTDQNVTFQATIKALSEAMATRPTDTKSETREIIAEIKNGGSNADLLKEMEEMKKIFAEFAKTGMPVIAPEGEPLPVKVEAVVKK